MLLRKISISRRLAIQLLVIVIGLGVSLGVSLLQLKQALIKSKTDNTRMLVDTAYSVLEKHYEQYELGLIDEEMAKAAAIVDINKLRYDGDNYFWVNDICRHLKSSLNMLLK